MKSTSNLPAMILQISDAVKAIFNRLFYDEEEKRKDTSFLALFILNFGHWTT